MALRQISVRESKANRALAAERLVHEQRERLLGLREQALGAVGTMVTSLRERLEEREDRRARYSANASSLDLDGGSTRGSSTFRGASRRPSYEGWSPLSKHPDLDMENEIELLRGRARDLQQSNPLAAAMTNAYTSHICGSKPWNVQSTTRADRLEGVLSKDQVLEWRRWCEDAWESAQDSIDERERPGGFWGLLRQAFHARLQGDCLLVFTRGGRRRAGAPNGFKVRVEEADLIRTPDQFRGDEQVRIGVRYDDLDAADTYYVFSDYSGDSRGHRKYRSVPRLDKLDRVQAQHLAIMLRPSQGRGLPWITPSLTEIEDVGALMENELLASLAAGSIGLLLKDATGLNPAMPGDAPPKMDFHPGSTMVVPEGYEPQAFNPQRPNASFEPFVEYVQRIACASVGMSAMLAFRDWRNASFSSSRMTLHDSRKTFEWEQHGLARTAIKPSFRGVVEDAWMDGRVPGWAPLFDRRGLPTLYTEELLRCSATPPAFGWIDPAQEVNAYGEAVRNRFMSRADVIGQTSQREPEDVFEEIGDENDKLTALGLATNDASAGAPSSMPTETAGEVAGAGDGTGDGEPLLEDGEGDAEEDEVDQEELAKAQAKARAQARVANRKRNKRSR